MTFKVPEHPGIAIADSLSTLGDFADPKKFTTPINIDGLDKDELLSALRMMCLIRISEDEIGKGVLSSEIKCPCHLVIGQEAIAVGIASQLNGQACQ